MKTNSNTIEIRLCDLFAAIFKAAKPIICVSLLLAMLGGLWGAYKTISDAKNPSVTEDDISAAEKKVKNAEDLVTKAEKSLNDLFEIEIPDQETRIVRAKQLLQRRQDYINNSLYYAMNPFHRGISRVSLFVETDTPINPNAPWMSVDPQSSIVIAATRIYPFDSETLTTIKNIMGTDAEIQYINELVSVSNVSNQIIEIRVYHDNTDIAKQVTDYLLDMLQNRLSEMVGGYSANVIAYFVGYEVDWAMNDSHNAQDDSLLSAERNVENLEDALEIMRTDTREIREQDVEDAKTAAEDAKKNLDDVKKQFSTTTAEPKNVLKKSFTRASIFLLLGFAFSCFVVLTIRVLNGKLQDIGTVLNRYSFPVIGILPKQKKRWFDRIIRELEGEPQCDFETAGKAAAQSLISLIGDKKVAFVSSEGHMLINKILPFTQDRIPVCGDIIKDADAMKSAVSYEGFILVEERGKSRINMIDNEVRRIDSLGRNTEGIIIL